MTLSRFPPALRTNADTFTDIHKQLQELHLHHRTQMNIHMTGALLLVASIVWRNIKVAPL